MLFNDKSTSMSGVYFRTLQQGCLDLGEQIFNTEDASKNTFETVDTIFFQSNANLVITNDKDAFDFNIKNESAGGGTDFMPCFRIIVNQIKAKARNQSEFVIIFFTDG